MTTPIELIPLRCTQCETPVPAQLDEVAWVCQQCGQGLLLHQETGLEPHEIFFAATLKPNQAGKPYWVGEGRVQVQREAYGTFGKKTGEAQKFWGKPRLFFIPAFDAPLDDLLNVGTGLLRNPPPLERGPAARFLPATLASEDVGALAEFIVMAIEAERRDKVKTVNLSLKLTGLELWILPYPIP